MLSSFEWDEPLNRESFSASQGAAAFCMHVMRNGDMMCAKDYILKHVLLSATTTDDNAIILFLSGSCFKNPGHPVLYRLMNTSLSRRL